jgi:two-component system LytT family response regulator
VTERAGGITVIVADDEKIARRRVTRLLETTGETTLVAECAGGVETVARTRELRPQLLFLDVQMPDLDGFGVLDALPAGELPVVVFVTAFDRYAQKAFEVHAVDYLMKPYDTERFLTAFHRAKERLAIRSRSSEEQRLRSLLRDYFTEARQADAGQIDRLAVSVDGSLIVLRTADVDWIGTEGNYLRVHLGAKSYLLRETASNLEARLPREFVRIHRRFIVNLDRVVEVQPWFSGDGVVVMQSGAKLRLSRTYRDRLHSRLFRGGGPPNVG